MDDFTRRWLPAIAAAGLIVGAYTLGPPPEQATPPATTVPSEPTEITAGDTERLIDRMAALIARLDGREGLTPEDEAVLGEARSTVRGLGSGTTVIVPDPPPTTAPTSPPTTRPPATTTTTEDRVGRIVHDLIPPTATTLP